MNHPSAIFPNETYLDGLRNADETVVEALYNEFRQPVARAVEMAGGSYADGNTFFRVAVLHTAQEVNENRYPLEAPIYLYLKNLAVHQYQDWLKEKEQQVPETSELSTEEQEILPALPGSEAMRLFRKQIKAKRQFTKLSTEDQKQVKDLAETEILKLPESGTSNASLAEASIQRYKALLGVANADWSDPLPSWILYPLADDHFHKIWSACEAIERRLNASQTPNSGENKTIKYAFIAFALLTLGYAAFTWIFRDRTPAEVYENNFNPPASIMEDLAARHANDSIHVERPEACTIALSEADAYYKKREWRSAANALAAMMNDSLSVCQSDALFYLAIVGLQMERPELTIECIAKIEDLDRFGEDIYWYMALAYVKMAAQDPSEKKIARRAVQRALSNTEIPERRKQAEKMLEELGNE